ncbi:MAG: GNAT family N-acetyltransferase [Cetobacterium sp.]|uniref:GNAT family N-acetyltransferase n=1 Tax=Cetobacterium sp. TaxID=2071632 RepID=UPI003F2E6E43
MVTIRNICIKDYKTICKIYEELDNLHLEKHPELFIKPSENRIKEDVILSIIENPNYSIFVAEEGLKVIGFVECYIANSIIHPSLKTRSWIQIDNIAVTKKYQNKKIRKLLLEKTKEWAKEKNSSRIELTSYSFNLNTIKFYEKNGFNELSKKK